MTARKDYESREGGGTDGLGRRRGTEKTNAKEEEEKKEKNRTLKARMQEAFNSYTSTAAAKMRVKPMPKQPISMTSRF
jgi:hypothetical protein